MGVVARKVACGVQVQVAPPAGLDPVLGRNLRPGVGDRQDDVGAVTVGALGGRPVPQLGQLAVDAHRVLVGQVRMAIATAMGEHQPKRGLLRVRQIVSLMAVGATRPSLRLPTRGSPAPLLSRPFRLPVHTLLEPLFDESVTGSTRVGHVGRMQRGSLIRGVVHCVGVVAISAARRHQQPRVVQTMTVHADPVRLPFLWMATPAGFDLMVQKRRRPGVLDGEDAVPRFAMAGSADQGAPAALLILFARLVVRVPASQPNQLLLVAVAAGLPHLFQFPKAVLLGVQLAGIEDRRIAAMAIVAVDAVLVMDVVGELLRRHVQVKLVFFPKVGFAVAQGTSVLIGGELGALRRLRSRLLTGGYREDRQQ